MKPDRLFNRDVVHKTNPEKCVKMGEADVNGTCPRCGQHASFYKIDAVLCCWICGEPGAPE